MKYKNIYDTKIIVIDINFYTFETLNLDVVLSIKNIIKKLSASQNLLLITDNPINFALNAVESWGLKSGFIVANAGACTYNIATKKIISSHCIEYNLTKTVIKQAIWNNLNFVINTDKYVSHIFRIDPWLLNRSKFNMGWAFKLEDYVINDWTRVTEIIDNSKILNIEIFFHEANYKKRCEKIEAFLEAISGFAKFNYSIHEGTLFIFSENCSKWIATEYLASEKNMVYSDTSIYLAIDQVSEELVKNSYISAIQYKTFIDENTDYLNLEAHEYTKDWIAWINQHEYLWNEPVETKYRSLFQWVKLVSLKAFERENLALGKYKCLHLNTKTHEIFLDNAIASSKQSWINWANIDNDKQTSKIFIWPECGEFVLGLLKNKKFIVE